MEEAPSQKVQRVRNALSGLSFEGVQFLESKEGDVRCMGGFMTQRVEKAIHYDPLAAAMTSDDVLAFILLHEHWHLGQEGATEEDIADELKADDYALRKLRERGWDFARAEQCVIDFKIHEKAYFAVLHQEKLDLADLWESLTLIHCSEIWNTHAKT